MRSQVGDIHPGTTTNLHNLAELYYNMQQLDQAEMLMAQALGIRQRCLGGDHPNTVGSRQSLDAIRAAKGQG